MLHTPVRRGRPKGTGIDDNQRLAQLAELLRIRPDLRPTTAIRQMGYSDPSAIRRLRDRADIRFVFTGHGSKVKALKQAVHGEGLEHVRSIGAVCARAIRQDRRAA